MANAAASSARLRRGDRNLLLAVLGIMVLAGWAWLFHRTWAMRHMDSIAMAMPSVAVWHLPDLLLVFAMWAVMMASMMLPSATPMVLLYARTGAGREPGRKPLLRTWAFVLGYLAAWTGFSLLASLLQWALHALALIWPMMVLTPAAGGVLLLAAGIYQWTPFKQACLAQCRAPLGFLLHRWRNGMRGAAAMGIEHGAYCVGCCWMLMLSMFALGMMNLLWIALLSLVVLLEKSAPGGAYTARAGGAAFTLWGAFLLLQAAS